MFLYQAGNSLVVALPVYFRDDLFDALKLLFEDLHLITCASESNLQTRTLQYDLRAK